MAWNISLTRRRFAVAALTATALAIAACGGGSQTDSIDARPLSGGAVAAGDRYSAAAGEKTLRDGGNAIDAAVAVAFALAVTYPEAGNIGGGGFMTLYVKGAPYFLDYREMAPAAATQDMYTQFQDASGAQDPVSSLRGAQSVGVPGTVRGMWEAHRRFGKLPWSQVMAPAIALAEGGYLPSQMSIDLLESVEHSFGAAPYSTNLLSYFGGMRPSALFLQPELAATLKRIAADGADEFYQGQTADLLIAAMGQDGGKGIITHNDLKSYKAVWRTPLTFDWKGQQVVTAPPPSSGGIALAQLLKMKGVVNETLFKSLPVNSAQYIHLNAEMMKRVFADRAEYLGDPDFVQVPVAGMVDDAYIHERALQINPTSISLSPPVLPGKPKFHTTHYSIVDAWGNAVSNTYTLNIPYGSGVVVKGAGFVLNDEMDDFATVPGQPNIFGVIGGTANAVAPGKRPLSSMSPTIVVKEGLPTTVIGTPGGSRIFTAVYQVLTNLYDYQMDLPTAVANPRFHHQLPQGKVIEGEPYSPIPTELAAQLKVKGYDISVNSFNTDIQAIVVKDGEPTAAADPRGRGVAMVVK